MQLKEKKEMDDAFKKAQKPWLKLLQKVNKAKADYHNACKSERTAINQERNAASDTSNSPEQVKNDLPCFPRTLGGTLERNLIVLQILFLVSRRA